MAQVYKTAGIIGARLAGESAAMDEAADELQRLARAEAAQHADTEHFQNSIESNRTRGKNGVIDRLVVATDPGAESIEFGHLSEGKEPVWVAGKHSMRNAMIKMVEG